MANNRIVIHKQQCLAPWTMAFAPRNECSTAGIVVNQSRSTNGDSLVVVARTPGGSKCCRGLSRKMTWSTSFRSAP